MYKRDEVVKDLRENVLEVYFTKVDGSERLMRCTLKEDLLPDSYKEEKDQETDFHQKNQDVVACWDVQKGGWRSFRIDSIKYIQIIDAY